MEACRQAVEAWFRGAGAQRAEAAQDVARAPVNPPRPHPSCLPTAAPPQDPWPLLVLSMVMKQTLLGALDCYSWA